MEIPAPQDFLFILHQVCDKVIKVSVFTCFLATAVTIKIIIIKPSFDTRKLRTTNQVQVQVHFALFKLNTV